MSSSVPGQLLSAIKARKFTSIGRMFAPGCDFEAWTPSGHWTAQDGATIGKIFETWFSPGVGSVVTFSHETQGSKGSAVVECEITWKLQPEDQPRVLRQVYLMTIKSDRIVAARIYCAGLHTEFPEVDLEKQRRAKGLAGAKPLQAAKAVAVKAG
jgi:hypothetical protein